MNNQTSIGAFSMKASSKYVVQTQPPARPQQKIFDEKKYNLPSNTQPTVNKPPTMSNQGFGIRQGGTGRVDHY